MGDNKSEIKREKFIVLLSICIVLAVALAATLVWTAVTHQEDAPDTEPATEATASGEPQTETEPPETEALPESEYASVAGKALWDTYLARLVELGGSSQHPSGIVEVQSEDESQWLLEKYYSGDEKTYTDGTYTYKISGSEITVTDAEGELYYTGANEYEDSVHYVSTEGTDMGTYVTAKNISYIGGKLVVIRQVDRVERVPLTSGAAEILNKDNALETETLEDADETVAETAASTEPNTAPEVTPVETEAEGDAAGDDAEGQRNAEEYKYYTVTDTVIVVQSYTYVELYTLEDGTPTLDTTYIVSGAYDGFEYSAVTKAYQIYCDYDIFGGDMSVYEQYIPFYVTPDGNRQVFEADRVQPADSAAISATYAGSDVVVVVQIASDGSVDDYMAVYQIGYTSPAVAIAAGQ